jgi:UrcA family protein
MLFALAALAAATAVPSAANIPHNPITRIVRYTDLDLGSAAGRARLEQRIDAAVRDVCAVAPGDAGRTAEARACRAATLAQLARPAAPAASGLTR